MKKGEFKILESIPTYKINKATGRLNRPVVALFQGSRKRACQIKLHEDWGLSCDCPSWIFNTKGNRECKHTLKIKAELKKLKITI